MARLTSALLCLCVAPRQGNAQIKNPEHVVTAFINATYYLNGKDKEEKKANSLRLYSPPATHTLDSCGGLNGKRWRAEWGKLREADRIKVKDK
jgi:hypothetical protein